MAALLIPSKPALTPSARIFPEKRVFLLTNTGFALKYTSRLSWANYKDSTFIPVRMNQKLVEQ